MLNARLKYAWVLVKRAFGARDIYDQDVAFLQTVPNEEFRDAIYVAWSNTSSMWGQGGSLFRMIGSACLTMVKHDGLPNAIVSWEAATPALTNLIRLDNQIPAVHGDITKEILPHFAKWQRFVDCALNRTPPDANL